MAVLAATLVVGAAVQGLVGLGLGLVAAPVVTLVREHHEIDWPGLGWSMAARVPGTVLGVWLLTVISERALGIAVGLMVLLSVLLTAKALVVPVTRTSLVAAGVVSGVTGTATSIGGPPMAILLQHRSPHQIRSTLGVYFIAGAALSLVGLGLAGALERSTFVLAMTLVPCLVVGFALSRLLAPRLPRHQVRMAVLLVCAASAVALLVRSVV